MNFKQFLNEDSFMSNLAKDPAHAHMFNTDGWDINDPVEPVGGYSGFNHLNQTLAYRPGQQTPAQSQQQTSNGSGSTTNMVQNSVQKSWYQSIEARLRNLENMFRGRQPQPQAPAA